MFVTQSHYFTIAIITVIVVVIIPTEFPSPALFIVSFVLFFLMLSYFIVCHSYVTSHRDRFHSACGKRRHFTSLHSFLFFVSRTQKRSQQPAIQSRKGTLVLPFVPCRKNEKNGKQNKEKELCPLVFSVAGSAPSLDCPTLRWSSFYFSISRRVSGKRRRRLSGAGGVLLPIRIVFVFVLTPVRAYLRGICVLLFLRKLSYSLRHEGL